jgi:hypothetical protein
MVWIALALMGFAVALVAVNTAAGRWGMHHWRYPRRVGPTYLHWVDRAQLTYGAFHRQPGAHGVQLAVLGSCRAILHPQARTLPPGADTDPEAEGTPAERSTGPVLGASAFQVFSQWAVFSIFLTFLLPVWSLSFATEALGGERESHSMIWLLTRPLPRPLIYLGKFVALLPWALGLNLAGFAFLCLAAGPPGRLALGLYWPAVLWASLAFSALYFFMGAFFRRAAVIAIVYSFCLEVVLGNMPGYLKRLSVGFYTRCLMYQAAGEYGIQPDKPSVFLPVDGTTALVVLVGATLGLLGLGMFLFARTQYHDVE